MRVALLMHDCVVDCDDDGGVDGDIVGLKGIRGVCAHFDDQDGTVRCLR